jgi:hypothetical protein
LVLRARWWTAVLAGCAVVLAEMGLFSVFDEFTGVPGPVQAGLAVLVAVLLAWRLLRVGVEVSPTGLGMLNVFKDKVVAWESVRGVKIEAGAGELGHTEVPCIELADGELTLTWLTGYALRRRNKRVARQTEAIRAYWVRQGREG